MPRQRSDMCVVATVGRAAMLCKRIMALQHVVCIRGFWCGSQFSDTQPRHLAVAS